MDSPDEKVKRLSRGTPSYIVLKTILGNFLSSPLEGFDGI